MESELKVLTRLRRETVALLYELAPIEGYNLSALPDVRFVRSNRPLTRTPVLYDPGIVIVCQGRKRGYLGEEVYLYDADHYLVVSVPLPFAMETDATEREPMLAIYLRLDFNVAADLMLQLDERDALSRAKPRGMATTRLDVRLSETVLRLLQAVSDPLEAQILGPALVREIYFRVFMGDQGGSMRAALNRQGHFGSVSRALRKIHQAFAQPLTVEELAAEANMSVSTFHAHFKDVTDTSPIQYIKSTRLHQARLLMARSGLTAAAAAAKVGYESSSQFSREFKRLFGSSPIEEVQRMQRYFAVPAPAPDSIYVSSH
ncbi:AraC family transcriptional regulator [Caballeronia sp. DA-9]|uniref:AraC family transcriptional regulator n=1 Tax=Caballeronia sp. DA-9 TaxID=3436237 RepID=UPI003F668496